MDKYQTKLQRYHFVPHKIFRIGIDKRRLNNLAHKIDLIE